MDEVTAAAVPQPRGLHEVVGTNLEPFLRGFQESSFQHNVADFVERHALAFAVVCPDGSHPHEWHKYHEEYRSMFEKQFTAILDELDIERDEFLEWFTALRGFAEGSQDDAELPGTGGVRCCDLNQFLEALTASEDYQRFVMVMFRAVAESRRKAVAEMKRRFLEQQASHRASTSADAETPTQDVQLGVPAGVGPGQILTFDFLGTRHETVVPDGYSEGSTFSVTIQLTTPAARQPVA